MNCLDSFGRVSSRHFRRNPHRRSPSHPPQLFRRNKNPQTHPEASLLVPTELGRRGFESLLEHDSKTQPPFVYMLGLTHSQLGGRRQDNANASGFKVSLMYKYSNSHEFHFLIITPLLLSWIHMNFYIFQNCTAWLAFIEMYQRRVSC